MTIIVNNPAAAGAGSGDVIGPGTNTDLRVPQWNGANSKTLKDGLDVGTGANKLVQFDSGGKYPAADGSAITNISALTSKTGSLTRVANAASGSQSVTGVGFQPTSIHFDAAGADGSSNGFFSHGYVDSSKAGRCAVFGIQPSTPLSVASMTANAILIGDNAGAVNTKNNAAIIASFDSDGFTLTWTKTGTPNADTITINFICYK